MHRIPLITCMLLSIAVAANAQTPRGDSAGAGPRRFQPPPDHWMTIDSLSQALGLNASQRTKIAPADSRFRSL